MNSRNHKAAKKLKSYNVGIEAFIERLKKMRALDCDPSDMGIDASVIDKVSFNRYGILTRIR